ncbi:MAG: hypothetical protein LBV04_04315 [Deferribacteraceae bacterium]|jgi:hypothetical protein|nr:hypothetical protein [Deferribacteraceae bacterium]
MKKLLIFLLVSTLLACASNSTQTDTTPSTDITTPAARAAQWEDGAQYQGYYRTLGSIRNLFAMDMIVRLMAEEDVDRVFAQCFIDNAMATISPDDFLAQKTPDQSVFDAAVQHCSTESLAKIPPILDPARDGMSGDEARTYLQKEVMLDCLWAGNAPASCACSAEAMAKEIDNVMSYLKVIDTRETDMLTYRPDDKQTAALVDEIYKNCGIVK